MSLKKKNTVVLFKVESVYGTDPTPVGANALQVVSNLQVSPLKTEVVQRDLIQGYFGQNERVTAHKESKITFEVEMAGHGSLVMGAMPKIDPLIRACGFSGAQTTRSITGITRTSNTATATTAAIHGLAIGDKVLVSGANQTDYNITATVLSVPTTTTFTYAVANTPVTPATGTIVMNSTYVYTPITTSIPSVTFYAYFDGTLHKITGARGNMMIDLAAKAIPRFKFEFTGIYNAPSDSANPSPDITAFTVPLAANTTNTPTFSILGYSGYLESISLNMGNLVNFKDLIGVSMVEINDRKGSGSMSIEATSVAQKDFWSAILAQTTGALAVTHGTQNGNIVSLAASRVMLDTPDYKELNGTMMFTSNLSLLPTTGNDEFTITFS